MRLMCYLNKPEYLFRPLQILERIAYCSKYCSMDFVETRLPWGLMLRVHPHEAIGSSILKLGLYDLTVSETIWRLLEPGGCALDVGANIGHMSSIMAVKVGEGGTVHSFEPHPQVYQELDYNVQKWSEERGVCRLQAHNCGLSDVNGEGIIEMPESFDGNRGTAFVVNADVVNSQHGVRDPIQLQRLDDFWAANGDRKKIDLMKIDVEGHELSVLKGAAGLIELGLIRDIVFEENRPYPTDVTDFLAERGYDVFLLEKGLWGPLVSLSVQGRPSRIPWEPPTFLATKDPQRAMRLLKKSGWEILVKRHVKYT